MNISSLKTVIDSIKHWYIPLIIGIVLVLTGIYVFATPLASYLALSVIFSISFLLSGILQVIFSVSNREELDSWGWYLAAGILYTLFGLLLVSYPGISIVTLPFIIGFYVLSHSVSALGWAFDLKNLGIQNWGTIALIGVLGIIFSFILIWNPSLAGLSLVIWTGLALVFAGIASIMLSLGLKKIKDLPGKIPDDLKKRIEGIKKEYRQELSKT
jgi:uncharacterized membrane protein HdeD (DUF308 family)